MQRELAAIRGREAVAQLQHPAQRRIAKEAYGSGASTASPRISELEARISDLEVELSDARLAATIASAKHESDLQAVNAEHARAMAAVMDEAASLRACVLERDDAQAQLATEAGAAASAHLAVVSTLQARLTTAETALQAVKLQATKLEATGEQSTAAHAAELAPCQAGPSVTHAKATEMTDSMTAELQHRDALQLQELFSTPNSTWVTPPAVYNTSLATPMDTSMATPAAVRTTTFVANTDGLMSSAAKPMETFAATDRALPGHATPTRALATLPVQLNAAATTCALNNETGPVAKLVEQALAKKRRPDAKMAFVPLGRV